MEFCPKCGCVLIEKKKNFGCPRCEYVGKSKIKIESSEKIEIKPEIGIVDDKDIDVFPIVNAICPKCKHGEAYFWQSKMRAGDEAEVSFFRCTKCKHTWREYR